MEDVKVQVEEMTAAERRALQKEKDTLASFPRMPMMLIKARKAPDADAPVGKVAWGIKAVKANSSKLDGKGVTVAVLDTGIDAKHPAFEGVNIEQRNFTTEPPEDLDGHGTHCAGVIFGHDKDGPRIGIARNVEQALIGKVLGAGGGSSEEIVKAIMWAKSWGAHVISMSLGMDFMAYREHLIEKMSFEPEEATSIALAGYQQNTRVFDSLSRTMVGVDDVFGGGVLVAAAGNESHRPNYSIILAPPASGERMVSVAALGREGASYRVAEFSNEGAMFAAPGEDIWSAMPGGGLIALSGTSMATPHVAGVAALWAQKRIEGGRPFSADWVVDEMKRTAVKLPFDEEDVGHGLVQAPRN